MKFRTEVEVGPFRRKIGYGSRILAVGSCFADNMAAAMQRAKFSVAANPTGVVFNPASIALALRMFSRPAAVTPDELRQSGGRFFDFRFHGSLSGSDAGSTAAKINRAVEAGSKALAEADTIIITFGTAWVYTLNETGEVVANCHRQPASIFTRKRLTVSDIVDTFSELLQTVMCGRHIIFTISPVRHLGDGADENFLSKATLKLAVAELVARFENADYFPAYEILNDDLRDYRFYADDLVHPSSQAVAYIREKFFAAALDSRTLELLPRVERAAAAAGHRPSDTESEEYRSFCRARLADIAALESECGAPDFSAERAYFSQFAQ